MEVKKVYYLTKTITPNLTKTTTPNVDPAFVHLITSSVPADYQKQVLYDNGFLITLCNGLDSRQGEFGA